MSNRNNDLEHGLLNSSRDRSTSALSLASSPLHSLDAFYHHTTTHASPNLSSIQRETLDNTIPIHVKMEHVDYFVGPRLDKHIIKDVSLHFQPGKLACLMGPSGSGKTTCLNLILGNAGGQMKKGQILVNEEPGPPRDFKSVAKLIPQEDVLLPSFTVRETLNYHGQLVLPQSTTREERQARIDAILTSLGLQGCADTRVGNVEERGISGGQRKRVSISMELLSNPCVLCVDEPTSGLDSSSAEDVISILRDLSQIAGKRTVICTIHQPSYRIFCLFDEVNLLTQGRVAYSGPMHELETFFLSIGHAVPAKENPIDHFMRLLQDESLVEVIPAAFAKTRSPVQVHVVPMSTRNALFQLPRYPTSTLHQIRILFQRQSMDYAKDPNKFVRMLSMKLIVGVMVGTVWWQKANPPRQSELFAVQGALFLLVFNGIIDTLAMTILTFPLIRSLLLREYKNGSYSVLSFYVATMLSMGLFGILFVLCMAFPVYFMVGFEFTAEKFSTFMAAMGVTTLIGNALGVSVGAASKDLMEAQNMLVPLIAPLALFSGYVIPKAQIPHWALPFYYASFFQYAIALYELNCFTGMVFEDFNLDIFHPLKIRPLKTGEQFLKTMGLDPETHHVSRYMLILVAYAVGFTLAGYFVVKRAVSRKSA